MKRYKIAFYVRDMDESKSDDPYSKPDWMQTVVEIPDGMSTVERNALYDRAAKDIARHARVIAEEKVGA